MSSRRSSATDPATILHELRALIVRAARLTHVAPESLDAHTPLPMLGIDSIDILEIVVHVERSYGLKLRNDEQGRAALRDLATLAATVSQHLTQAPAADDAPRAPAFAETGAMA